VHRSRQKLPLKR